MVPRSMSRAMWWSTSPTDWVTPRLTTVRQPLADMAAVAARIVLQLIDGEEPETMRVELATTLVVRESTAAPAVGRG